MPSLSLYRLKRSVLSKQLDIKVEPENSEKKTKESGRCARLNCRVRKTKMKTMVALAPSCCVIRRWSIGRRHFPRIINARGIINISIGTQKPRLSPFSSQFSHSEPFSPTTIAMASSSTQSASAADSSTSSELNVFQLIQYHQEKAARLPPLEEIRTVLDHSSRGMLSTFSQKHEGYPSGSMVDFACDAYGSPILAVSSLAVHTKDLLANPKCSLLIAKDPEDRTDLVITLHGDAVYVSDKDREAIRTVYLARHPNAFWVDFGDFQFLRIEPKVIHYVSGIATASLGSGEFSKEEYRATKVDPIYQFSKPIVSHMNKDHGGDTKLIVQHSTSIPVDFAHMLDLDSLGFNVKAGYQGDTFKLRVPFPRRAVDRKDVKTLIVEMLQAAKSQVN
ncbi:glutamyl-tRNA reductase-binding protein, chloroplastic-like [Diospyros lotus]|uniref:glutamyl-tRNA reductase-binding protein, chloroplastic-like n=1 Tax=Diospyros lotus TaxID=55363 RepID=UPI002251BA76|nr:glutamyl-tRNA reductase-binding protein, chloroplastic-like [Diospyros lotus]XP_052176696.1 glutamyl-tRNA reductase-binding protein, chloroplastic-like [Diospyros lotus]XP_052176697.1 glutamyl-tRNA reductase-binding protein, chloroplastic-like [Diospyros lotus]